MEMVQQLLIVAAVIGALYGALVLLKRKGWAHTSLRATRNGGQPRLELIDRLPLTPQHSLHLVRMADRTLLVALSPNGCNLLDCAVAAPAANNATPGER